MRLVFLVRREIAIQNPAATAAAVVVTRPQAIQAGSAARAARQEPAVVVGVRPTLLLAE